MNWHLKDRMRIAPWILLSLLCLALTAVASAQEAAPSLKIGDPAPDITVEKWLTGPGGNITLKSLRGNAVVLEFWAAWCGPCVASIPHMNELEEKFKGKPIRFLAVTDDMEARVQNLLTRRPINAWVGLDTDDSAFKTYQVSSIPRVILIDKNGKLMTYTHPAFLTEEMLGDLLAGKPLQQAQQPPAGQPAANPAPPTPRGDALFEVSIRLTDQQQPTYTTSQGRLQSQGAPLQMAIGAAYGVRPTRVVSKVPLGDRKYAVTVKVPEGQADLLAPLLKQALEATFHFTARKEQREMDAYVLTALSGAGPGLKKSQSGSPGSQISESRIRAEGSGMEDLSSELEQILDVPVVDETGLKGTYDWDLSWDPQNAPSFFSALKDQLGLKLEQKKVPLEVLVLEPTQPAKEVNSQPKPRGGATAGD